MQSIENTDISGTRGNFSNEPAHSGSSDSSEYKYSNDYSADDDTPIDDTVGGVDDGVFGDLLNMSSEEIVQRKISKHMRELQNYFRANPGFVVEKGDPSANIINVLERKCYHIPDSRVGELFRILEDCRLEARNLHYTERQYTDTLTHSGLFIDFDRYQTAPRSQVTIEHYKRIVKGIAPILHGAIDLHGRAFKAIFTRKPRIVEAPTKLGVMLYRDGFHMVIPELAISKGLKRHILEQMAEKKVLSKAFNDIPHTESPESMIDAASYRNPIHFMGHAKVDRPPYVIESIIEFKVEDTGVDIETIKPADIPAGTNLTYEMSLGFVLENTASLLHAAIPMPDAVGVRTAAVATPQEYNPWLRKERFECRPEVETHIQHMVETGAGDILAVDAVAEVDRSVDMLSMTDAEAKHIARLLDIIDVSYASEYNKWFQVLCAIASVSVRYRDLAKRFSMRAPTAWSEAEFDRVWTSAVNSRGRHATPVTKRSIVHWARESSPARFREINNETYSQLLRNYVFENEGRVEHAMVARLLHSMVGEKFITDVENPDDPRKIYRFFEFVLPEQSHRPGEALKWRKEADPDQLHLFMSDQLRLVYRELLGEIKQRRDEADSEALIKYWTGVSKQFATSMYNLSNNTFQVHVIRQAQYRFRQRGFMDELDNYDHVLGVGNGVLVLGYNAEFINSFHEYRISKFTDTAYIPYDPANPYIVRLLEVFHDIFPEPDVCEFMLFHGSTWLDACEPASLLLLLVGGGQNGKSFFLRMIHSALGNAYVSSGKIALLTSPVERAESANSAQMQMKGKRGFYFEEANKCETLNSSRIKTITSPGYQSGRDLHQRQENFRNTCNPIAASNFDFVIDSFDHGTWRRIDYYKAKVKFCARPNPDNPYEKREDPRVMKQYPNDPAYRQAMLSILVHYNERLRREYENDLRRVPCPTIDAETHQFRRRQDTIHRYITDMIVVSPEAPAISLQTVAIGYQEWYSKMMRGLAPSIIEVTAQFENSCLAAKLENRGGNHMWLIGHRVRTSIDEPLNPGESEVVSVAAAPALTALTALTATTVGVAASADAFTACRELRADAAAESIADNIDTRAADVGTRDYVHTRDTPAPTPALPQITNATIHECLTLQNLPAVTALETTDCANIVQ